MQFFFFLGSISGKLPNWTEKLLNYISSVQFRDKSELIKLNLKPWRTIMCLIGWTYFYLMIMPCFIFILHVPWISPLSRGEISYDRLVRGSLRRSLTPTTPLICIQPSLHNQTMVEKWRSILPEKKSWKWSSRSDHNLFVYLESPNWRFLLSYSYYVDSILRKTGTI